MKKLLLLGLIFAAPARAESGDLLLQDWNVLQVTQQHIAAELSAVVKELADTRDKLKAATDELDKLKATKEPAPTPNR